MSETKIEHEYREGEAQFSSSTGHNENEDDAKNRDHAGQELPKPPQDDADEFAARFDQDKSDDTAKTDENASNSDEPVNGPVDPHTPGASDSTSGNRE